MIKKILQKLKFNKKKYTLMIIPHEGGDVNSIKFSSKIVNYILIYSLITIILVIGAFTHYRYVVNKSHAEINELKMIRVVHQQDIEEIKRLQKLTNELQVKINQLNKTDKEIRKIIGE